MASQTINIDKFRKARRRVETDPVIRIIDSDKLPSDQREQFRSGGDLRKHVVSRSNELLRQLKVKLSRRSLSRQDSAEARAAIVLEHVLRTSSASNKAIPLNVLGSPLGLKKKNLEDLQRILCHYIHEIEGSKNRRQTRAAINSREGRSRSGATTAAGRTDEGASSSSLSHHIGKPETIHDLSIRLGSLVHDTEGCARRAEALFHNIKRRIEDSADHERGARLSDLKRNQAAYESACFYVSVKESEGGVVGRNPKPNVGGGAPGDGFSDGEEDDRNLSIANVASAARLSQAAVKEILPEVETVAEEFRSHANRSKPQHKRKKGRQDDQGISKKKQRGRDEAPTKRGGRSHASSNESLQNPRLPPSGDDCEEPPSQQIGREDRSIPPKSPYVPSAKFLEWKNRVLSEAKATARQTHASSGAEQLSDHDALDRAANDVIRRRRLHT